MRIALDEETKSLYLGMRFQGFRMAHGCFLGMVVAIKEADPYKTCEEASILSFSVLSDGWMI